MAEILPERYNIPSLAESIPAFFDFVCSAQTFALTTHVNPDGDALGSQIALYLFLQKLGKSVTMINASAVPYNFTFLAESSAIHTYSPERDDDILRSVDAIIELDANSPSRLHTMAQIVLDSPVKKAVIDHHLAPRDFAEVYVWDTDASSTAELVWRIIDFYDASAISPEIATALYTGIMTDSGSFRFPRTDAELHRIVAGLLDAGANPVRIYDQVFNQSPRERALLLGKSFSKMEFYHDGKVCILPITLEMLRESGANEELTEGFVQETLAIAGVRLGVLAVELEDKVKMSFRSKGDFPANKIAAEFGGGGHLNAAGARVSDTTLRIMIEKITQVSAPYCE